jgi:hypothetical protein
MQARSRGCEHDAEFWCQQCGALVDRGTHSDTLHHRVEPMERKEVFVKAQSRVRRMSLWALIVTIVASASLLVGVAPGAGAASSNTLTVTAGEYTYKLSGSPQRGWVQINFVNSGVELHMLAIVALKPGVTSAELKKAALSQDDAAFGKLVKGDGNVYGTPDLLSPGQSTTTISELKAGHYGIMCFVPAAGDGQPHIAHGMVTVFDVKASKSSFKPPQDGVTDVTVSDTAITVPSSTAPQHATLKVTNSATTPHNFTVVKLETGKTTEDAYAYYTAFFNGETPAGTAPGQLVGGISSVGPGGVAYLEWDLKPGHYGYASTDSESDNADLSKGFAGEFDVK